MGFTSKTLKGDHNLYMFELEVDVANSVTGGTGNTYDDGTSANNTLDELVKYKSDDVDLTFRLRQNPDSKLFWLRVYPSGRCNIIARTDRAHDFDMSGGSYDFYSDTGSYRLNHGRLKGGSDEDYISVILAGEAAADSMTRVTVTSDQGDKLFMYTFEVTSAPIDTDQVAIGIRQTAGNATT